jgi:hypothetical protein
MLDFHRRVHALHVRLSHPFLPRPCLLSALLFLTSHQRLGLAREERTPAYKRTTPLTRGAFNTT